MNCADFTSRLHDEFEGLNTLQAADLVEHVAQCATCCATWESYRLLSECIGAWRRETPDVDLAPAVVFALSQPAGRLPVQPELASPQPIRSRPLAWHTSRWMVPAAVAVL